MVVEKTLQRMHKLNHVVDELEIITASQLLSSAGIKSEKIHKYAIDRRAEFTTAFNLSNLAEMGP